MSAVNLLFLALGSVAGGFARYFLAGSLDKNLGGNFPYGTLAVNLAGCFLIGFLSVFADEKNLISPQARLLLMTGFCGAFTTFSAFMLDNGNLLKDGHFVPALVYLMLSVAGGFAVFRAGIFVARIF